MARRVTELDAAVLARAPEHVRTCLAWQLDPVARAAGQPGAGADAVALKQAWLADVRREWGGCGEAVVVDDEVVGALVYAPAAHLPGAAAYPTSPTSPDAVLMASVLVDPAYAGRGLGRVLVQAMARDLLTRYGVAGAVRAVEAIADTGDPAGCAPPAGFCTGVGFHERRAHPRHPRLRLDLRACVSWRDEVEQVIDRIRSGVRVPHQRPVPNAREPRDVVSRGSRGGRGDPAALSRPCAGSQAM